MPIVLTISLSFLPALIELGKDVTAIEIVGANDVRTCLRHVSPARSNKVTFPCRYSVSAQVKRRKATSVQYYLYDHAGRLTRAEAKLENTGVDYTQEMEYDLNANGNMTQDRHSAITSISYNVLNLPAEVLYEGLLENRPVSQMVYDASGRKHIVRNGVKKLGAFSGDVTRYVGDYIIVNDTVDRLQTPYGYLRDGEFHSYVFDYQGNVMVVVSGDKVDQTNLYYADGLPMNVSTDATANRFKYSAKELSLFRGLPVYDYTARHTLPQLSNTFRTMDPCAESFYSISPYSYCGGDPINCIDPTGMSTFVMKREDVEGIYDVVGGDLEDNDLGVYVVNSAEDRSKDIMLGTTTSITSFYDSGTTQGDSSNGEWKGYIDTSDQKGNEFFEELKNDDPSLADYAMNARNFEKYDFKTTNGNDTPDPNLSPYRGMPFGKDANGNQIYTSARDIGNIGAGYISGIKGLPWIIHRIGCDAYQRGREGKSSVNAQRYGWEMGHREALTTERHSCLTKFLIFGIDSYSKTLMY